MHLCRKRCSYYIIDRLAGGVLVPSLDRGMKTLTVFTEDDKTTPTILDASLGQRPEWNLKILATIQLFA